MSTKQTESFRIFADRMKKSITILLFFSLLLAACQKKSTSVPSVSVTIEPLCFFVNEISAHSVPVQAIVPAGSSPETYEPTPRQMVELSHSDLYIKVGRIGFETTWMDKLKANAPQMRVLDSSVGIHYIESSDGIQDPHTWMSCANARIIAKNICQALILRDQKNRDFYEHNLQRLLIKIDSVDNNIRQRLAASHQRSFVIYHPALTYFAHDYHLLQLPMEEEGREPNAASIQHLIEQARATHVQTIFVQREFSPRNTIAIRNATKAKPIEINPLSYDWPHQMLTIASHLQ